MAAGQHELALCARQCPAHHSGATEGAPPSHLDLLLSPLVIARRLYHDPAPPAAGAAAAGEGSAAAAQGARRRHALPLPGACTGRNNRGRCVGTPGTGVATWVAGGQHASHCNSAASAQHQQSCVRTPRMLTHTKAPGGPGQHGALCAGRGALEGESARLHGRQL